jgi:hypothetical protein
LGCPHACVLALRAPSACPRCWGPCWTQGLEQQVNAELRGLAVKAQTRLLQDGSSAPAASAAAPEGAPGAGVGEGAAAAPPAAAGGGGGLFGGGESLVQTSILEPCDITALVKMTEVAQVGGLGLLTVDC